MAIVYIFIQMRKHHGSDLLDDRLQLEVVVQAFLAQLAPDARVLEPSEGRHRGEGVVAVHVDRAHAQLLDQVVGL